MMQKENSFKYYVNQPGELKARTRQAIKQEYISRIATVPDRTAFITELSQKYFCPKSVIYNLIRK